MLKTTNLTKDFGNIVAVNNLNLKIEKELFVFLGPNGAGKTTTIKMMTGLLRPTAGSVKIFDYDLHKQPVEAKRLIGLVPETPYLYGKLTAREFMYFMADLYKIDRRISSKRLSDLIDLFDLGSYANNMIQTYSHGMQRKCSIAGALIHDPQVLFLDEPTVGLDPKSARNLKSILSELVKRGVTIFMSTHILEIAENMCDRIGIIHEGELIACGKIEELRTRLKKENQSLEDIFLELTEGNVTEQVLRYLDG
ncbi:ABC transporter ATP-binding protein [candidate division KSB1 bacterium]|nr:ABC transporter ATP-binding protein [candidate division KSB1 bacterium]